MQNLTLAVTWFCKHAAACSAGYSVARAKVAAPDVADRQHSLLEMVPISHKKRRGITLGGFFSDFGPECYWKNTDLGLSCSQQSPEDFETIFWRDNQASAFRYAIGLVVPRGGADFRPWAPIDAQSRQSPQLTVVCQAVDERIRCSMVRLSGRAEQRRR